MNVSNNSFFNSVVKELYFPDTDLSLITNYTIYKLRNVNGYYNSVIRLDNSDQSITYFIYISYNEYDDPEIARTNLPNGYFVNRSNDKIIHSIIDFENIEENHFYSGTLQLQDICTSFEHCICMSALFNRYSTNTFSPFYNITSAVIKLNASNQWNLEVIDSRGIVYQHESISLTEGEIETPFGIITINNMPETGICKLNITTMFDSADSGLSYYNFANIDLSKWIPTIGSGLLSNEEHFEKYVKDSDSVLISKHKHNCIYLVWNQIVDYSYDEGGNEHINVNLSSLKDKAQVALRNKYKLQIVFLVTNLGTADSANSVTIDGITYYYHFPSAKLDSLAKYDFTRIDTYTQQEIQMYNLDWSDQTTRETYLSACSAVVNAMKTTQLNNSTKKIIDCIDVVKIGYAGTWGEGIDLDRDASLYPPLSALGELFGRIEAMFTGCNVVCLRPLGMYFNNSFPEGTKNLILQGQGFFYDGVGANIDLFCKETAHSFHYNKDEMNNLYISLRNKPVYLECAYYISTTAKPSYQNLVSFVKYFRPTYFSFDNFLLDSTECKYNIIKEVQELSRFTGVKLALTSFYYYFEDNLLHIKLRLLNCGTSKIFYQGWKLRYYLLDNTNGNEITYDSTFNLLNIKSSFEPDSPNWHDITLVHDELDISSFEAKRSVAVRMAIVDDSSIYNNMYLSNTTDYIERHEDGTYTLFSFTTPE